MLSQGRLKSLTGSQPLARSVSKTSPRKSIPAKAKRIPGDLLVRCFHSGSLLAHRVEKGTWFSARYACRKGSLELERRSSHGIQGLHPPDGRLRADDRQDPLPHAGPPNLPADLH